MSDLQELLKVCVCSCVRRYAHVWPIKEYYGSLWQAVEVVMWELTPLLETVDTSKDDNQIARYLKRAAIWHIHKELYKNVPEYKGSAEGGLVRRLSYHSPYTVSNSGRVRDEIKEAADTSTAKPLDRLVVDEFIENCRKACKRLSDDNKKIFEILLAGGNHLTIEDELHLTPTNANQRIRNFVFALRKQLKKIYGNDVTDESFARIFVTRRDKGAKHAKRGASNGQR